MVGDPFAGKTKVLEVLSDTLNLLTDRAYDDENVNKVHCPTTIAATNKEEKNQSN